MPPTPVTLLQDWIARRDWLLLPECDMPPELRDDCRAILTEIIDTNAPNPAASLPCKTRFRPEWRPGRRELVIHDHSHGTSSPVVQNETESRERIQNVLQRLKKLDLQSSTRIPESNLLQPSTPLKGSLGPPEDGTFEPRVKPPQPIRHAAPPLPIWTEIEAAITQPWTSRWIVYQRIEAALSQRKALPEKGLEFLCSRAGGTGVDAGLASEFLLRCGGEGAMKAALRAWKDRLRNQGPDFIVQRLRLTLQNRETQAFAVKLLKTELGGDHGLFRLELFMLLGALGSLEEAGYLFDLLRLPKSSDEHPQERAALLQALKAIAIGGRFPESAEAQAPQPAPERTPAA